jgi:hypothetical protein
MVGRAAETDVFVSFGEGDVGRGTAEPPAFTFLIMSAACNWSAFVWRVKCCKTHLLSNPVYHGLEVTCWNQRHDRRINYSEILSAVHHKLRIDNTPRVERQHRAGAAWMKFGLYSGFDDFQNLRLCSVRPRGELEWLE